VSATLLLSGFEPFGGSPINPSLELVRRLDGRTVGAWSIRTCVLPVVTEIAPNLLDAAIVRHRPAVVVACGENARAAGLEVERVAMNLRDHAIADNAGNRLVKSPIVPGGPQRLHASLPVEAMVSAALAAGVPASLSSSAGTYLCNEVMYELLRRHGAAGVRGGVLHIPRLPGQASPGAPSMPLDLIERGAIAMLAAIGVAPAAKI
jgi:pyroglutamyl-peptidase